jgi:uncharacterized membrane protein YtjA (UPF0391 family)
MRGRNQPVRGHVDQEGRVAVRSSANSEVVMLNWAIVFLIVALIAGVLGFGGISATAAGIAKILFFIFLILFIVSLIARLVQGRRSPPL